MVVGWTPYLHLAVFGLKNTTYFTRRSVICFILNLVSGLNFSRCHAGILMDRIWISILNKNKITSGIYRNAFEELTSGLPALVWIFRSLFEQYKVKSDESVVTFHICKHQTFCVVNKSEKWQ